MDLDGHVCRVGLQNAGELHSNMPVLVETKEAEVLSFPVLWQLYAKEECNQHQWVRSQTDG